MTKHKDHANVKFPPPVLALFHIAAAFVLLGLALAFPAVRELVKAHTTIDPQRSVTTVVMNGPYQFTRNPIYLGFVGLLIGFPMLFGIWWGWSLSLYSCYP